MGKKIRLRMRSERCIYFTQSIDDIDRFGHALVMFNLNEPELVITRVKDFCFTIKKLIDN